MSFLFHPFYIVNTSILTPDYGFICNCNPLSTHSPLFILEFHDRSD